MSRKLVLLLFAVFALALGVATANAGGGKSGSLTLSNDVGTCPGFPDDVCFGTLNGNGLEPGSVVQIEGFRTYGSLAFVIQRPVDANGRVHVVGNLVCGQDQDSQFVNFVAFAIAADGTAITSNVIATAPC